MDDTESDHFNKAGKKHDKKSDAKTILHINGQE